jgi:hypothetical protein
MINFCKDKVKVKNTLPKNKYYFEKNKKIKSYWLNSYLVDQK